MPKYYAIESRECADDNDVWEVWSSDSDPLQLLKEFVNAVSEEQIDDVNRYWRVTEEQN